MRSPECSWSGISKELTAMNLELEIIGTGSKRIEEKPRGKEPDSSWRPVNLPQNRSSKWPTLAFEWGWSESLERLRMDAEWWLINSHGDVKAVVPLVCTEPGRVLYLRSRSRTPTQEDYGPGPL